MQFDCASYQHLLNMVLLCSIIFTTQGRRLTVKQCKIQQYIKSQAYFTNQLLSGYDKRFIPAIPEEPLEVNLKIEISDVLRLDEQEMECELIIYIRQIWRDYRLSWNSSDLIDKDLVPIKRIKIREHFLDKIWLPDIRISNLKEMNQFEKLGGIDMDVHSNGRVYFSQLALVKLHCPMDLFKFPMDQQICFLNFSSYAYSKSLLRFTLKKIEVRHVNLPHFDFVDAEERVVDPRERLKTKRVSISLTFKRRSGHYILHIYIPTLSLVILSWLALLMNPADIANRLALVTAILVSIVFLHSEMNTSLPPVFYATASDWFELISFTFVLLTLLESSLVYRLSALEMDTKCSPLKLKGFKAWFLALFCKQKQAERSSAADISVQGSDSSEERQSNLSTFVDKLSIFLFPITYCAFNIFYWFYYI